MGVYTVALTLSRSRQGHMSCVESLQRPGQPAAGMTWWVDGRYRFTTETGARLRSHRMPLATLKDPELAYRMPGSALLDQRLPAYTPQMLGATVQIAAEAVLEEPDRVELQLLLAPRGQVPEHRETVGDRLIEDGEPSLWMVLARFGGDPASALAAFRPRPRPILRTSAQP
jgi:hypothetical protein